MTSERHTLDDDSIVVEVIWNARPRSRTRHEVRFVYPAGGTSAWYPYDDQAMGDVFGLTVPDRYR